jgi:ectoine hydroxylase-related dioxygenase (phytanoyl-CoA dioxygenase family)
MSQQNKSILSPQQLAQYHEDGYFIARDVLDRDHAMEIRGIIKDHVQRPDSETSKDTYDPMDPMADDTPDARAARFRKLNNLGTMSPVLWDSIYTNPTLIALAEHFIGGDLLIKYSSCFLKPAKTGSATPWHQDNGLWRDFEVEPFNFWMAIDPATRENGCLQFIPGSHREPITQHVLYEDSVHAELPHEKVDEIKNKYGGVDHIELEPGDAVCWHSNLYHYSPPNPSPKGRIAVAGVLSSPTIAEKTNIQRSMPWAARDGEALTAFPPEMYDAPGNEFKPEPHPVIEPTAG